MKGMKIAGLCLLAVLAASLATAASASATPIWEGCLKGASGTKYTNEKCEEASGTGEWAWSEIKGTEKSVNLGSVALVQEEIPVVGTVEVHCLAEGSGTIGPGRFARTEKMTFTCSAGKNCEKVDGAVEAKDLPWHEELFETEKEIDLATGGKTEKEAPGWKVTCNVLGVEATDECKGVGDRFTTSTELRVSGILFRAFLVLRNYDEERRGAFDCTANGGNARAFVAGSEGDLLAREALRRR
jgi:hypothetical protein